MQTMKRYDKELKIKGITVLPHITDAHLKCYFKCEMFVLLEGHTSLIYFLELFPKNFTSENEFIAQMIYFNHNFD